MNKFHLWEIRVRDGSLPLEIYPQIALTWEGAIDLIVDNIENIPKYLPGYLKRNAVAADEDDGKAVVTYKDLGSLNIPIRARTKKKKGLPSYEAMMHTVTEGLYQERRNSPDYAGINDLSVRQSVEEFVGKLPEHQLRGIYFTRFNPDARPKKEKSAKNDKQLPFLLE